MDRNKSGIQEGQRKEKGAKTKEVRQGKKIQVTMK